PPVPPIPPACSTPRTRRTGRSISAPVRRIRYTYRAFLLLLLSPHRALLRIALMMLKELLRAHRHALRDRAHEFIADGARRTGNVVDRQIRAPQLDARA